MTYKRCCDSCGKEEDKNNNIETITIMIPSTSHNDWRKIDLRKLDLCKECRKRILTKIINELKGESKEYLKESLKHQNLKEGECEIISNGNKKKFLLLEKKVKESEEKIEKLQNYVYEIKGKLGIIR